MSDTPALRIYLCGNLAIEGGGAVIREADFPARQGRLLWAYLVLNRTRPVSRDDLAEAIWGDDIPDRWDATINAIASRLRGILRRLAPDGGAPSIHGEVGRYALKLPSATVVDWERARSAMHATDALMRRNEHGAALAEARVATEIACRGFLIGETAVWVEVQRRAMADMYLNALAATVEGELHRGNHAIAETEARLLLQTDPLSESGYRLLMRVLAARGNRAQLPRVMDDCRRALHDGAALAPSVETERLFRDLIG